ncbi:MAG: hypothetical protein PHG15_00700 [Acinetobacter sp.]|uniref:hypothetical protein n=1 Tax=Acinetobacter sp. TaxID=472 RepID=UPI00261E16B7|nr:hypothetical protein [Acinetobacter sp.]MDD2944337.1 hypothetical protein [Acinetobacter sp.]
MQPLDFTRTFNFETNTLQNHAHNLAMFLAWVNLLKQDFSPNHCLTILSYAYGYKSFTALNEAIKKNEVLEPLQPKDVYLERLRKSHYSFLSDSGQVQIFDYVFEYIVAYILDCKLDLNLLAKDSPLKSVKLSAEKTAVSMLNTDKISFINSAILNTLVTSTFDQGLPESITIDKNILDIYDHDQSVYFSLMNQNKLPLNLFDPQNITDLGYGKKRVQFPQECLANYKKLVSNNGYVFSIKHLAEDTFKVGKTFSKYQSEKLIEFTDPKKPIGPITIDQNDYKFSHDEILEIIRTRLFNISLANITEFQLDLKLSSIGLSQDKNKKIDYDLSQRLMRCYLTYSPFEVLFSEPVIWRGEQYTLECNIKLNVNIHYEIDCIDKPKIKVSSISLNPEKGIESYFTLYKTQQDEVDHSLFTLMTINPPQKMPYESVFIKAINQKLNQYKFELACFYSYFEKSVYLEPVVGRS